MKKLLIVLLIIVLPSVSFAFDFKDNKIYAFTHTEKWDKTDKVLLTAYITTEIIDCLQTREILSNPQFHEKNPILKNYSKTEATIYFTLCSFGGYYIADHLNPKPRKIFLTILTTFQIRTINNNRQLGVHFRF